jgi:hypothetical protein
METIEVEIFTTQASNPIIKLPFRKYPGVVIQGDTLRILYCAARELNKSCKAGRQQEAEDLAAEIMQILEGHMSFYETTLRQYGLDLPYPASPTNE